MRVPRCPTSRRERATGSAAHGPSSGGWLGAWLSGNLASLFGRHPLVQPVQPPITVACPPTNARIRSKRPSADPASMRWRRADQTTSLQATPTTGCLTRSAERQPKCDMLRGPLTRHESWEIRWAARRNVSATAVQSAQAAITGSAEEPASGQEDQTKQLEDSEIRRPISRSPKGTFDTSYFCQARKRCGVLVPLGSVGTGGGPLR